MNLLGRWEEALRSNPDLAPLQKAISNLRNCVAYLPDLLLSAGFPLCKKADEELLRLTDRIGDRAELAIGLARISRLFLDRAGLLFREIEPSRVESSETLYDQAVIRIHEGMYASALSLLHQAILLVIP
jgi:hypothetical protein